MMLICRAELLGGRVADVRVIDGMIAGIGEFVARPGERVFDAAGGLLLPGLHDHHLHIAATAASLASVRCGPPQVMNSGALQAAVSAPGQGWLRGIGYHESVAGVIDRHWLDGVAPTRPVRIQHRSGRMWFFNSAGLDSVLGSGESPPVGLERAADGWTGRLFEGDAWLRTALRSVPPSFAAVGAMLARYGVTGVTDMTPANDDAMAAHFAAERRSGALPQRVVLAGQLKLGAQGLDAALTQGPVKIHLHEADLPEYDAMLAIIRAAHAKARTVAVHCVTEVELVFAVAAFEEVGVRAGDRIEHASVMSAGTLRDIAALGLAIVSQPNFIRERGDAYLGAIASSDIHVLYRLGSVISAGVTLAGGTDTPFGEADPWAAMNDAMSRRTAFGATIGLDERLSAEQALDLFIADPLHLDRMRRVEQGEVADFCLLRKPWSQARTAFSASLVRATVIGGEIAYDAAATGPG